MPQAGQSQSIIYIDWGDNDITSDPLKICISSMICIGVAGGIHRLYHSWKMRTGEV